MGNCILVVEDQEDNAASQYKRYQIDEARHSHDTEASWS
jgi:hypothetical protein